MDLSLREQAAVDRAAGRQVFASYSTLARGRADLRRRYGAPTFAEALRRHQMAEDEHAARVDALERRFEQLNATIERALSGRGNGSSGEVERQARRIEDEFTPDELKMVRDHREYESFKRNVKRYGAELEREAALAQSQSSDDDESEDDGDDEVEDDDGDDEDEESKRAPGKTAPGSKRKPAAKKKAPPARHPKLDDDDSAGDTGDERPGLLQRLMAD